MYYDVFHDMFVYVSGLGRGRGTKNQTLAPQDPQQVYIGSVSGTIEQIYVYWIGGVQKLNQAAWRYASTATALQHHTSQAAAGLSILSPNFLTANGIACAACVCTP